MLEAASRASFGGIVDDGSVMWPVTFAYLQRGKVDLSPLEQLDNRFALAQAIRGMIAAQMQMGNVTAVLSSLDKLQGVYPYRVARPDDTAAMEVVAFLAAHGEVARAIDIARHETRFPGVALALIAESMPPDT